MKEGALIKAFGYEFHRATSFSGLDVTVSQGTRLQKLPITSTQTFDTVAIEFQHLPIRIPRRIPSSCPSTRGATEILSCPFPSSAPLLLEQALHFRLTIKLMMISTTRSQSEFSVGFFNCC